MIKLILHFFAVLPLPIIHKIANLLAKIVIRWQFLSINQVTRINLSLVFPQLSEEKRAEMAKNILIESCKTFAELGLLWLNKKEKVLQLIKKVTGEQHLQQALAQGKGVILLTPHLGAWELAGLYATSRYPITALYRPPKLQSLHKLIYSARSRAGGHFVATNKTGVRSLYKALYKNQIAGILPDQVPTEVGSGIFVPFFGVPSYTMVLVSRLSRKQKCPVVFTYAKRLPQGQGFHIYFLAAPQEINADNLKKSVTALNQGIEMCIKENITQYQWNYKRFKRRPKGLDAVY
ncbi:MAG: lysophospholipid acyltransferase family protein [Thiomargarita sp.]|nr:lysophospholipid acyltransferase family protein [Thiomargarita sp.]